MPGDQFAYPTFAILVYISVLLTAGGLSRFVSPAHDTTRARAENRYHSIDGLRGYLAYGVFIHHCVVTWFYLQNGHWQVPPSNFYTQIGQASVALFFMITAFLFWGKMIDLGPRLDWRNLYISRLFRLYPLYLLMLGIILIIVFGSAGWVLLERKSAFIKELIQWLFFSIPAGPDLNLFANTAMLIAFVTWSLQYEWLFYLALPILGMVFAKTGKPSFIAVSIAALLLLFWSHGWQNPFMLNILQAFLGGILAAYWVRQPRLSAMSTNGVAGLIAIVCLFSAMFFTSTAYDILPTVLLSIFFVVVASGNTLFGTLKLDAALWLGEISYSVYLLHGLLVWFGLQLVFPNTLQTAPREIVFSSFALLLGIILVILCSMTYLWIEKPGIATGKRFIKYLSKDS